MVKYKYWHIITDVSSEWKKIHPEYKIGLQITHSYKHNGCVDMIDLEIGKEYPCAYSIEYLGRIETELKGDLLFKKIGELVAKYKQNHTHI